MMNSGNRQIFFCILFSLTPTFFMFKENTNTKEQTVYVSDISDITVDTIANFASVVSPSASTSQSSEPLTPSSSIISHNVQILGIETTTTGKRLCLEEPQYTDAVVQDPLKNVNI